jgi:hypothetical protein
VRDDVARALQAGGSAPSDVGDLVAITRRLGVTLRPTHPGDPDPTLAGYFVIEVRGQAAAARVIQALRGSPAVESAYVEPPEETA